MAKKKIESEEDILVSNFVKYKKYLLLIVVALPSLWGGGKLTDKIFFEEYRKISQQRDSVMIENIVQLGEKQDTTNMLVKKLIGTNSNFFLTTTNAFGIKTTPDSGDK